MSNVKEEVEDHEMAPLTPGETEACYPNLGRTLTGLRMILDPHHLFIWMRPLRNKFVVGYALPLPWKSLQLLV